MGERRTNTVDWDRAARDEFGGTTALQREGTGFFRLEETAGRWWLFTPKGNAFLIHGLDHVARHIVAQPYNREHWEREFGLSEGADPSDRLNAFYSKKVVPDREYLGFNCLYSHEAPVGVNAAPYIPRARSLNIEYWRTHNLRARVQEWTDENFLDVFADSFLAACHETGSRLVREGRVEDPWLVAYGLTDCPILVPLEARPMKAGFYHKPLPGTTTWPVRLRNLGAEAPGKRAYVDLMRDRYNNEIKGFNATYNTAFDSWEDLVQTENWRRRTDPSGNIGEERDDEAFLLRILDRAWGTQVKVLREYDPNHLIFGDTLNVNSPLHDGIIEVYAKHFPMIVYQYYGATWEDHRSVLDRLRRVTGGMPVFSADSCWSVCQPPHMPDTLGPQCAHYGIAADRMEETYRAAFARPDFLGWGWCGWMDQWESAEPVVQHSGLQDAFGNWHQPLASRFSEFGKEMYTVAQPHLQPPPAESVAR